MPERSEKLLFLDLLSSIEKIRAYTAGMAFADFQNDQKTIDAVVRNFEIIGEAAKRFSKEYQKANTEIPWSGMIGLRNKIIHDYFGIDVQIIWKVITEFIPEIEKKIREKNS